MLRVPPQGACLCHHSPTGHTLWNIVGLDRAALLPSLQLVHRLRRDRNFLPLTQEWTMSHSLSKTLNNPHSTMPPHRPFPAANGKHLGHLVRLTVLPKQRMGPRRRSVMSSPSRSRRNHPLVLGTVHIRQHESTGHRHSQRRLVELSHPGKCRLKHPNCNVPRFRISPLGTRKTCCGR